MTEDQPFVPKPTDYRNYTNYTAVQEGLFGWSAWIEKAADIPGIYIWSGH